MANAPVVQDSQWTARGERSAVVDVDPDILAVIKSASVPVGVPKNVLPPETLPGTLSHLAGIRGVLDVFRRGVEALLEVRAKHGDVYRTSMAGNPMVVVWDADAVNQILRNEDRAWSTGMG